VWQWAQMLSGRTAPTMSEAPIVESAYAG
jgi:hypothetical protein